MMVALQMILSYLYFQTESPNLQAQISSLILIQGQASYIQLLSPAENAYLCHMSTTTKLVLPSYSTEGNIWWHGFPSWMRETLTLSVCFLLVYLALDIVPPCVTDNVEQSILLQHI